MTNLPTLYDFWAPWCGPCRAMAPSVEEIEKKYAGKLKVQRVNVDDHPAEAEAFNIRSIPTLVLSNGNQEVLRIVGARPLSTLEKELSVALDGQAHSVVI